MSPAAAVTRISAVHASRDAVPASPAPSDAETSRSADWPITVPMSTNGAQIAMTSPALPNSARPMAETTTGIVTKCAPRVATNPAKFQAEFRARAPVRISADGRTRLTPAQPTRRRTAGAG